VLLVDRDPHRRGAYSVALQAAEISVCTAGTLAEAKALLHAAPPSVLITQIRLAEYNGMHLAHWGRMRAPMLRSVVIGESDPFLEREARAAGFLFLRHDDEQAVVQAAREALVRDVPRRCWNRKLLIPRIAAHIDQVPALIMDISYGGFRAQLQGAFRVEGQPVMTLAIRSLGVEREAICQWVRALPVASEIVLCGARVGEADTNPGSEWRLLVDSLPHASPRPE
jgi:CheY-like chemotaxis protein